MFEHPASTRPGVALFRPLPRACEAERPHPLRSTQGSLESHADRGRYRTPKLSLAALGGAIKETMASSRYRTRRPSSRPDAGTAPHALDCKQSTRQPERISPMSDVEFKTALIVGAGSGLSASLARALASEGIKVALAARSTADLDALTKEIGASAHACDASKRADVEALFQ